MANCLLVTNGDFILVPEKPCSNSKGVHLEKMNTLFTEHENKSCLLLVLLYEIILFVSQNKNILTI